MRSGTLQLVNGEFKKGIIIGLIGVVLGLVSVASPIIGFITILFGVSLFMLLKHLFSGFGRIPIRFVIFSFLVIGLGIGDRLFAYIHIAGQLYVSDFILGILILFGLLNAKRKIYAPPLTIPFLMVLLIAIFSVVRGAHYGFEAIRQSVLLIYSVWFFVAISILKTKAHFSYLFKWGAVAVFANVFVAYRQYATHSLWEGQRFFSGNIVLDAIVLIGTLIFFDRIPSRTFAILLLCTSAIEVIISYQRSDWLGVLVAGILVYFLSKGIPEIRRTLRISFVVFSFAFPLVLISFALLVGDSSGAAINYISSKLNVTTSADVTWRFLAWHLAFSEFSNHVWDGIGFGPYIIPTYLKGVPTHDPHNSLLSILVRIGVTGSVFFVILMGLFYRYCFKHIPHMNDMYLRRVAMTGVGGQVISLVMASSNPILEGPQQGIYFWITMSIVIGAIVLDRQYRVSS